jgi:hypothetical protein
MTNNSGKLPPKELYDLGRSLHALLVGRRANDCFAVLGDVLARIYITAGIIPLEGLRDRKPQFLQDHMGFVSKMIDHQLEYAFEQRELQHSDAQRLSERSGDKASAVSEPVNPEDQKP